MSPHETRKLRLTHLQGQTPTAGRAASTQGETRALLSRTAELQIWHGTVQLHWEGESGHVRAGKGLGRLSQSHCRHQQSSGGCPIPSAPLLLSPAVPLRATTFQSLKCQFPALQRGDSQASRSHSVTKFEGYALCLFILNNKQKTSKQKHSPEAWDDILEGK